VKPRCHVSIILRSTLLIKHINRFAFEVWKLNAKKENNCGWCGIIKAWHFESPGKCMEKFSEVWSSNGHSLQILLSSGECHCMHSAVPQKLAATIVVVIESIKRKIDTTNFHLEKFRKLSAKRSTAKASIRNSHLQKGSRN